MDHVTIGSSPLRIAPLVFGGNVFGWTLDQQQSFAMLDAFVDRGFNCIDTADCYARFAGMEGGESETAIGNWFAQGGGRRERVVLCTKVGFSMGPGLKGLSAAYIEKAVESSLRRLRTDYIDLYISHQDDADTPLEETLGAYQKLIAAGKVRAIGASNYSGARLAEALELSKTTDLPRYESLQPLYNLYDRETYEQDQQQVCVEQGVSVFPYFALASGFLAGKYRTEADFEGQTRASITRRYLDERGLRILAAMDRIAGERAITLPQIALAWLLTRPGVTAPVASATSLTQLEAMAGGVDLILSPEERQLLEEASRFDPEG
ncbi:MAG: aldo/keto reductase [Sphingobium sp.]